MFSFIGESDMNLDEAIKFVKEWLWDSRDQPKKTKGLLEMWQHDRSPRLTKFRGGY